MKESRKRILLDRWLLESPLKVQWIKMSPLVAYLRKTPVAINGTIYEKAITLANCSIRDSGQGRGHLGHLLQWMEDRLGSHVEVIYVESVLSPRMQDILAGHGWLMYSPPGMGNINFYKLKKTGAQYPKEIMS